MPDDLLTFVSARLDEEVEGAPHAHERGCELLGSFLYATKMVDTGGPESCDCNGPRATLDRVAALRTIVALHPKASHDGGGDFTCDRCRFDVDVDRDDEWPCPTLRALASAWRSHPDWRAEWAPEGVEVAR